MFRASRFPTLALAVALIAGACSSAELAAPPVDSLPFGSTTSAVADGARFGGVFQLGLVSVGALDPTSADLSSTETRILVDLLFDGLTEIDPKTGEPAPAAASSWQQVDDVTWRFSLDGSTFANGRVIEPADVKWSLERFVSDRPGSRAAQDLEVLAGYEAFANGEADEIEGLVVAGSLELMVELEEPFGALPSLFASPSYGIVPQELIVADADAFGQRPQASGPFQVTERTDQSIVLERTDRYGGSVHGIEAVFYDSAESAVEAFDSNAVDWVIVPPERVGTIDRTIGSETIVDANATIFFGMNSAHPNLADQNFRRAIVRSIDVPALVEGDLARVGAPLRGIVPMAVAGVRPDACGDRCAFAPTAAAGTVSFAFPDGDVPTLSIDYLADDPTEQALATALQEDLVAVGIPTELRPGTIAELSERILAGEHQLFRYGWVGGYASPDAWLGELYSSSSDENVSAFVDPAVDLLLADAQRATGDEALALYNAVEDAVLDAAVVVPVLSVEHHGAISLRVNALAQRADGTLDVSGLWLQ